MKRIPSRSLSEGKPDSFRGLTMAWPLFFLALLSYCSSVTSQPTVTQPASSSVAPGQTAKLSCTGSNGGSWYYFQWHQQKPGQAPRFLLYGTTRGEGIPDRFTGSSYSVNPYHLTISNTQAEDEAIYYCLAWESNSNMLIFGGGTQLTVSGQPTVPPTVNVFPPSQAELRSSDKATLVCLIDGFYPGSAQVTWLADGTTISSGVQTTKPAKLNDKYAASSYLSMEKSAWERCESVSCKVEHEGKTFEKQVRRSECA